MIASKLADRIALGVLGVTSLATAAAYPTLPARVATHFDWRGRPDSWQPRALAAVLLPGIALAMFALFRWLSPRLRARSAGLACIGAATVAFLCIIHICVLAYAKNTAFDVVQATSVACGGLYVALGLGLPRLRQNPYAGVRTPWTLRSPEVWARTQRMAGWAFCVGGAFIAAIALTAPSLALPSLLITTLAITVASWLFSRRISARVV
jgi:uncharacterized membrane protein